MQDDVRTALAAAAGLEDVLGVALAAPVDGLSAFLVGLRLYLYAAGDHEGGVEAQPEVADDGYLIILVLVEELLGA